MSHEFRASIVATLPDGAKEMARRLSELTGARSEFLEGLATSTDAKFAAECSVNQTKTRPATNGPKRGRKAKTSAHQMLQDAGMAE